jgi:Uma2 family endonuclease
MATVRLSLGPADQGRQLTLDEFWDAEEQPGYLYELARGVLEVSEIPSDLHWQIVHNLHELFSDYLRRHPGSILRIGHGSDVRYLIPEFESDRHPDLALLLPDPPLDIKGRPRAMLAVEVVSPGERSRRRDYDQKREEYLAVGLLEYWVVDPELRQVLVLVRREVEGVALWSERRFSNGETILSEALTSFAGAVSQLWAGIAPNS